MREMDWPPRLPLSSAIVERPDLHIAPLPPAGATLISGDLDAAVASLAVTAPRIGLGDTVGDPPFLLVIARDRACLISQFPLDVEPGWDPRGFAITPADDAWVFFEIAGTCAGEVVGEGCAAALGCGSPSTATMFAGHFALLTRRADGFLLGVGASDAEAVARWLLAVAEDLS